MTQLALEKPVPVPLLVGQYACIHHAGRWATVLVRDGKTAARWKSATGEDVWVPLCARCAEKKR